MLDTQEPYIPRAEARGITALLIKPTSCSLEKYWWKILTVQPSVAILVDNNVPVAQLDRAAAF